MADEITLTSIQGLILEEQMHLTLAEICGACAVHAESIIGLINEGVLDPAGSGPHDWRFTGLQMRHARTALRLQRDLEINTAGVALALQLLDEIEMLRAQLRIQGS